MANGDIIGDLATAYLTPEQQAALRGKRPAPTGDLSSASPDASGPVARATQQLGASAGQQPQQDVRQTSFDQTNTPAKYLDKGGRQQTPSLNDGLNYQASAPAISSTSSQSLADAYPLSIGDGRTAIYAGVGAQGEPSFSGAPSSLNTTKTTFGAPSVPQSQRVTSLSDAWQSAAPTAPTGQQQSGGLESAWSGYQRQVPQSPPQELSLASAAPGYQAPVPQQAPARSPSLEDASPSRGGPQSSQQLPQPLSLSNLAPGDFNGSGAAPSSNPQFASLGSAKNLGDGIGAFSQANPGDAKLAHDRFQRAIDLRKGYAAEDALARARQQASIDDSFTTVLDSSRPISQDDMKRARFDQAQKENDQQAIATASGLITARQQQLVADQQYRQAANLEDLRTAATAPDATPQQKAAYAAANDPDGSKALARQAQLAQIDASNARAAKDQSVADANGRKVKGLPSVLQKLEDADIETIGSTKTINGSLDKINSQIEDGTLQLGPWANTVSSVMNAFGASDQNSANFASFQTQLEKLRNDSLRLNKGTQTEGDAERAFNELFTNIKDRKIVQQRLKEISQYNNQAAQVKVALINNRRANQGLDPLDVDEVLARSGLSESQPANQQKGQAQPQQAQPQQQAQAAQQQPAAKQPVYTISTPDQFASLPHGAHFIDPQGNHRVKE